MGHPRRLHKKYETPKHPWQKERIAEEKKIVEEYGLKNKREVWTAKTGISKYRKIARALIGLTKEEREEKENELISKLQRLGIMKEGASLDDVLSLNIRDLLERRLQTIVWKRGFARTAIQARQLITHGHISVNERKVSSPSMIITIEQENSIDWHGSPVQIVPPDFKEKAKFEEARIKADEKEKKIAEKKQSEKIEKVEDKKIFECEKCGKTYKTQRGLKSHISKEHKKETEEKKEKIESKEGEQ